MNCTSCKKGQLVSAYLEGAMPCHSCTNCGGQLVFLIDYLRWLKNTERAESLSDAGIEVTAEETTKAMICPKSGRLMTKFRISKDTDHRLDLSPSISAIWMDKGEWALLKKNGLADKLNAIFTDHWQREVHEAEAAEVLDALYERKFGAHYQRIKEFRASIDDLPNRSEVIAFLLADDPYDV